MDYSKTFSIGDLKASSISAYVIDESKSLEPHRFAPEPPNHHPHHGGKFITDADWPALKPIIYRLYIIDNLTYIKLKEALNLEFGYNITKRQFTRKVESWGFKKNFRKNERDEIVKSGKIPQRFVHDSRINRKRVERLQKRNVARMGLGVESEDNERSLVQDQDFSPKTNAIKEASLHLEACHIMIGDQNAALEDHDMNIEEIPSAEFCHDIVTPNAEDKWPFSQSDEGDSGPSWLAELFVQLEIAEIIASTNSETEKQEGGEEARFISGTDLKELSKPYDNTLLCGGSFLAQRHNDYPHHLSARSASLQTHNPGMYQCRWSPLFEIDIFPPFRNSNNRIQNNLIHSLASFKRISVDLKAKLSKLERVLPANSPAIISTLEHLISVYHRLPWRRKVAMTCKKLLHARQKERFPNAYKIVESYLWIVDSCITSGDLKIGRDLHLILHPKIEKAVDSQHPLRIHSSCLMAEILYQFDQYREAEDIIRPAMQIALATLGHNHLLTIRVMNMLALILRMNLCLVDADRLARYSLQVSDQSDLVVTWLRGAEVLMQILETRELYNESANLCHQMFKFALKVYGNKKYAYLLYHTTMARALLKQNEASKAVDMLRQVQNYSYAYKGERILIDFTAGLGRALLEQGSFKEAIVYLKESLKLAVGFYGWDDTDVFNLFGIIVKCYRGLLRHDESLKFYEKLLEKWRMLMEKESSIKGWIRDIEDSIYEIRGRTKEVDESSHGDDKNEEEGDNEAQFGGRELSLDDIFNAERDTSKDISLEGLNLDEGFLLKFKKYQRV